MEVLLPNGDLLRTGQWAVSNSSSAHVCKNSFGPSIEGLFLQSNLGIVTKIAITVQAAPETHIGVKIHAYEVEDIEPLVNTFRDLYRQGVLQNHPLIMNINNYSSIQGPKHKHQKTPGPMTEETLKRLMKEFDCGYWFCMLDFYGPKAMVDARYATFVSALQRMLPTAKIERSVHDEENGMPLSAADIATHGVGMPQMQTVNSIGYNLPADGSGFGGHTDTSLILPNDGTAVLKWFRNARTVMESCGVDPFIGCHVFERYIIFVQQYVFDVTNPVHVEQGLNLISTLLAEAKKLGYVSYRSHVHYMGETQFFCFSRSMPSRIQIH